MKKVMLVGGGKIGIAITEFLSSTDDYKVTVVDRDAASLQRMPRNKNVELRKADIQSPEFHHEVEGQDIVLSATPYNLTATVAEACKRAGAHYLDLTEDVESTRTIKRLAKARRPRSFRSADWRRASSPSSPTILPRNSTSCVTCRCASAPCPCSRTTRSNTISPGRRTA